MGSAWGATGAAAGSERCSMTCHRTIRRRARRSMRASYAREQSGQRQPSRTGDQPGPEARSCSGENVCPQRQHVRPGHWDSGGMTHGSDMTREDTNTRSLHQRTPRPITR
jgi:hypothetical protein